MGARGLSGRTRVLFPGNQLQVTLVTHKHSDRLPLLTVVLQLPALLLIITVLADAKLHCLVTEAQLRQ